MRVNHHYKIKTLRGWVPLSVSAGGRCLQIEDTPQREPIVTPPLVSQEPGIIGNPAFPNLNALLAKRAKEARA